MENLQDSIKIIISEWEKLRQEQKKDLSWGKPKSDAVWVAKSDIAGSYEVDEEWIGISPQGNIVWAYASGCSCWDGDYDEDTKPTIKEFTLVHSHLPEKWEQAIIEFSETKKLKEL